MALHVMHKEHMA